MGGLHFHPFGNALTVVWVAMLKRVIDGTIGLKDQIRKFQLILNNVKKII